MSKKTEIIVALVGGTGTDFQVISSYIESLLTKDFCVHQIKVSNLPESFLNRDKFPGQSNLDRISYYQDLCDNLAKENPTIMGLLTIIRIFQLRQKCKNEKPNAYIISSLKREYEFKVLRRVYGHNLILISIYEDKKQRKSHLLALEENNEEEVNKKINLIIERDKDDGDTKYGQSVRNTYKHATYFVRFDTFRENIKRLFDILGGDPIATPTKDEVSMAQAYTIAMRSADLNRQVGAVLVDDDGNVLASGCNEVPKVGGGLCWPMPNKDQRDYYVVKEGIPISVGIKREIANNLIEKIIEEIRNQYPRVQSINYDTLKDILSKLILEKGELKDIIEFLRPVHGEEAAICDAALRGVPTKNATLYCNTYPCHLCTKKIIAAGIKRVVYIEAYPKSKAEELYTNIIIDKPPKYEEHPDKVIFESFTGFSPKRYFYM